MTPLTGSTHQDFLDELLAFTMEERNDVAIQMLELNALRAEGELTDAEFERRRARIRR